MPCDPELVAETRSWFVKAAQDLGAAAHEFTAEHLAAIALQTGRGKFKAYARLPQFIEAAAIDAERFQDLVGRHGLLSRWQTFERRFLQGAS